MSEKKTVLLQLGSAKDSKTVGEIVIVKERDGFVVSIELDADYDGSGLSENLGRGSVKFAGRVPTILDFYSDPQTWLPQVREALS